MTPTTVYVLVPAANSLVSFDTANVALVNPPVAVTGLTGGETLVGIDFRPQNGLLYGFGVNATADTGTLYAITTRTGVAGVIGTAGSVAFTTGGTAADLPDSATVGYGFDFNPPVDRVRMVAGALNFRVNPNPARRSTATTAGPPAASPTPTRTPTSMGPPTASTPRRTRTASAKCWAAGRRSFTV